MSDTSDPTAGERVHHDHAEPVIGCRCAERAALARGLTPEQDERMTEFFGTQIVHKTPAGPDGGDDGKKVAPEHDALRDQVKALADHDHAWVMASPVSPCRLCRIRAAVSDLTTHAAGSDF